MNFEEYGRENERIIVMLHGAYYVHSFSKQYALSDRFRIIVPHIMGYGKEACRVFEADKCTEELAEFIGSLGKKVLLVGFSLGAQLAVKLLAEHAELFCGAVVISPWLIKEQPFLGEVLAQNEKQYALFQKRWLCIFVGLMNGFNKQQRREFVEQTAQVKIETVRNMVDNGICLDTIGGFENAHLPIAALAGGKEQSVVCDSVKALARLNPNCTFEIWEKAAHNIPPMFSRQLNELIVRMAENCFE